MRQKPSITRYYKNTKTGQYCRLEGSPISIKRIESWEWPKLQKVMVKRVPDSEFKKNVPMPIFGYSLSYNPIISRQGNKVFRTRKFDDNLNIHDFPLKGTVSYYPEVWS